MTAEPEPCDASTGWHDDGDPMLCTLPEGHDGGHWHYDVPERAEVSRGHGGEVPPLRRRGGRDVIPSTEWTERAACRGVDSAVFFPIVDGKKPRSSRRPDPYEQARAICHRCEVRTECLEEQLALTWVDDQHGMFGGLNPRQRTEMRQQRRRQAS